MPRASKATRLLPEPDLTSGAVTGCIVGLRPGRKNKFRLERDSASGGRLIVHNYGHGGGGITASWGCAAQVRQLVLAAATSAHGKKLAVVGAGIMGLTCAKLLADAGFDVTIYAEKLTDTTSDRAGGQFAPSELNPGTTTAEKARFRTILTDSMQLFRALGPAYGVYEKDNYSPVKIANFDKISFLIPRRQVAHLPFAHLQNRKGWVYQTLLIEPPVFLAKLRGDLAARGVVSVGGRRLGALTDVPQKIIVNCSGLGARALCADNSVYPIRGQLVLLRPQPNLDYLFSTGGPTYVFPRSDHVVVGGSWHVDDWSETIDSAECDQILDAARDVFAGRRVFIKRLPPGLNPRAWR